MTTDVLDPGLAQEELSARESSLGQTTAATSEEETLEGRVQFQRLVFRAVEGNIVVRVEHAFVDWIMPIFEELCELLYLSPNWDSYGAPQIKRQSVIDALYLLRDTASPLTPKPWVVPTSHGGVQLEWHTGGIDLEIEINPHARGCIYYEDQSGKYEEKECNLKTEIHYFRELIEKLPSHPQS